MERTRSRRRLLTVGVRFAVFAALAVGAFLLGWKLSWGAVETTTVSGIVYLPDGTKATGGVLKARLSSSASAPDTVTGAAEMVFGRLEATIDPNGFVTIDLVPNAVMTPTGTYYDVRIQISTPTRHTATQIWQIPSDPNGVDIGDSSIRIDTGSTVNPSILLLQEGGADVVAGLTVANFSADAFDVAGSGSTGTISHGHLVETNANPVPGNFILQNGTAADPNNASSIFEFIAVGSPASGKYLGPGFQTYPTDPNFTTPGGLCGDLGARVDPNGNSLGNIVPTDCGIIGTGSGPLVVYTDFQERWAWIGGNLVPLADVAYDLGRLPDATDPNKVIPSRRIRNVFAQALGDPNLLVDDADLATMTIGDTTSDPNLGTTLAFTGPAIPSGDGEQYGLILEDVRAHGGKALGRSRILTVRDSGGNEPMTILSGANADDVRATFGDSAGDLSGFRGQTNGAELILNANDVLLDDTNPGLSIRSDRGSAQAVFDFHDPSSGQSRKIAWFNSVATTVTGDNGFSLVMDDNAYYGMGDADPTVATYGGLWIEKHTSDTASGNDGLISVAVGFDPNQTIDDDTSFFGVSLDGWGTYDWLVDYKGRVWQRDESDPNATAYGTAWNFDSSVTMSGQHVLDVDVADQDHTIDFTESWCETFDGPTAGDKRFFRQERDVTLESIDCIVVGGLTMTISIEECNPNAAACVDSETDISCGAINTKESGAFSDPDVDGGDWMEMEVVSTTSSPTWGMVCVRWWVD